MSELAGQVAYVTGGASGIGKAVCSMLASKGCKVMIADINVAAANELATSIDRKRTEKLASATSVDVTDWESQVTAFERALSISGRIDYVFPIAGIGERKWIPHDSKATSFAKPDLTVLDTNLTGVLYTVALAVQQFRRQDVGKYGFRGKIGCVASVCGFYCIPTLPVYTGAKHAITGFVRSYGKYLPEEQITMNAVNPNVVRTAISTPAFYEMLEGKGLLTPMQGLLDAIETWLGDSKVSGEIFEISPSGGYHVRAVPEYLDEKSREACELLNHRCHVLHEAER